MRMQPPSIGQFLCPNFVTVLCRFSLGLLLAACGGGGGGGGTTTGATAAAIGTVEKSVASRSMA